MRESVRRTAPSSTTQTSQLVPPMSKPSALPSPQRRARSPAPTAPPAGPERTLQAPARAASSAGATPPEESITCGAGSPAASVASVEPAEVAAEQGREVGVDRGGRGALVLAEARQHLVRGGDVEVGEALAQVLGEAALVGRVEVGEEQADRHRLGARLLQRRGEALRLAVGRAARRSPPARSARPPPASAPGRSAASASARRGGRGSGRSWRAISSRSAKPFVAISAVRAPRSSSSALVPTVIPWENSSTSAGCGARLREDGVDRRHHPVATPPPAWSAPSPCGRPRRRAGRRR